MKKTLLFMVVFSVFALSVFAQDRSISGKVTGDDGAAIPGANVVLKGTTTGTITDADGNYKLSVPTSGGTLVFSFIGYVSQEIQLGASSTIDVELASDVTQLTEVVVTGSAVGQSKKTLSFAVGSIDEELINTVPAPNIATGLQGKVAGVRVNGVSGQPGQSAFFQIRGANSLATGQQPLIIVDGVFLNGSNLADINPEDIEKVEVLKGSAGASLYGSQAANGVIQIFTKRGNGIGLNDTKVIYRGEIGVSQVARRYDLNEFSNFEFEDGDFVDNDGDGANDQSPDNIHDNPLPNIRDYQDEVLFRDAIFASNYLAVQGRTESTNFLASVQRLDQEGVIQRTDPYVRNAFRLNVDHRVSDKLDVSISSMYSTSEQDLLADQSNGPGSYIAQALFLLPIYDLTEPNEEDGSLFNWDIDESPNLITNPLYDRANITRVVNRTRLLGNFKASYDINDWLSVNSSVSLDRSTNDFELFVQKGFLSTNAPGPFFSPAVTVNPTAGTSGGGIDRSRRVNNNVVARTNLIFQKRLGDFNTAFRLSYLYEDLTTDFNQALGEVLAVDGIRSLDNATTNLAIQSETEEIVANSFFGIADINYQEKYIFSGLFRREGSSLFGPEERWANYYRLSGAYRVTEDFDIPGIQELKVRASLGTAGIRPTFEMRFETFSLQNGNAAKATLGNNALRPAQSREVELGLNASFLNRFNFEFNYADTRTEDQVLRVPLSGAAGGFTAVWRNAGVVTAETFELSLNTNIINKSDFSWDVLVTWDRTRQVVDELNVPAYNTGPGFQQSTGFRIEEGLPFGTIVGEVFATSLAQIEGQVEDINDYVVNGAGYVVERRFIGTPDEAPVKLVDGAGNPIVQNIGNIQPDFRMGFANTIRYKNISLYTLFDWKKGGDILNKAKHWLYRDSRHADYSSLPVSETFWLGLYNVNVTNNHFVEDGSFGMLRELALRYEFDKEQLSNVFGGLIENVKVGFIGRNLFTITNYSGFHPDITGQPRSENTLSNRVGNTAGSDANTPNGDPSLFIVDSFNYPISRTYTFSLQVTF
ncbi:MAG: SusC/RagA family TonB-linked outer membrane protein [Bacteroidota bacterium]